MDEFERLKNEVVEMMKSFNSSNRKNPTDIYFTYNEANILRVFGKIPPNTDVHVHFNLFLGLTSHWDSKTFKVE